MNPSLFIKTLKEKKLFLPPLSGYTDYPYRMILARFDPPFILTEMANARAVISGNDRTLKIMKIAEGSHKNGIQLIGSDPEYMKKAALIAESQGFDFIDINMGCTARKVTKRGEGVSLMKNEVLACKIISQIADAVSLPVTCKLRTGVTRNSQNVIPLSLRLAEAGAVAITVHGRTGERKFGVDIDQSVIKNAVENLPVPIIANGGVFSGADAQHMIQFTGAAAIMPGRGLIGNPWLVSEITSALFSTSYKSPTLKEKKDTCLDHLQLLIDFYGEHTAVIRMRRILPHYFISCLSLKELKNDMKKVRNPQDICTVLSRVVDDGKHAVYKKSSL